MKIMYLPFTIHLWYNSYGIFYTELIAYILRLSSLSHEFGSLHLCAPRKYIGRIGIRAATPRALRQQYSTIEVSHY